MKIPFWLLITLIIIVTYLFYLVLQCSKIESYLNMTSDFGSSVNFTYGGNTYIDPSAIKLTDIFYVFPKKGNVLQLTPHSNVPTTVSDSITNIKSFTVHNRDRDVSPYTVLAYSGDDNGVDSTYNGNTTNGESIKELIQPYIDESGNKIDSYRSWGLDYFDNNGYKNDIFYIPYGGLTFIHVVEHGNADEEHKILFLPQDGNSVNTLVLRDIENSSGFIGKDVTHKSKTFSSQKLNTVPTRSGLTLSANMYQIHENVYYHMLTGDLLVRVKDTAPYQWKQYSRYTNESSNSLSTINTYDIADDTTSDYVPTSASIRSNLGFSNSFAVNDVLGGNVIVYVISQLKTTILVLKRTSDNNGSYVNSHVIRFNGNHLNSDFSGDAEEESDEEVEDETAEEDETDSDSESEEEEEEQKEPDIHSDMSDYYKWYWYWNSSGNLPVRFSEDYMLKTQVVPPVCPSCPQCPKSDGCCTNCGGNGGDGTKGKDGKSMVDSKTNDSSELGSAYSKTLDTASDLLKSAGSGATGLAKDTLGLAKDTVIGGKDLVKDTVSGTVGLARETAGGAIDLTKDTVRGTLNVAEDVIDATGNVAQETADVVKSLGSGPLRTGGQTGTGYTYGYGMNANQGQPGYGIQTPYGQQGTLTGPMDPYTYNGKLKQRPSNDFLPRTADFSKFAK